MASSTLSLRGRGWWVAVVIAFGAVGSVALLPWMKEYRQVERARESLPPLPDLRHWPVELKGRMDKARRAVQEGDDPRAALAEWSELAWVNGFNPLAEDLLARLRELSPEEPRWIYLQAELALRRGQKEEARDAFQQTVALAPSYWAAWIKLGDVYQELGDNRGAGEAYARAVALAPGHPWAEMVRLNHEIRHAPQADTLKRAEALAKRYPLVRPIGEIWAGALEGSGRDEEARRQRKRAAALELAPPMEDPWLDRLSDLAYDGNRLGLMAMKYRRQDRRDECERLLRRAIAISPGDLTPRLSLAQLYQVMEAAPRAVVVLEEAVQALPEETEAWVQLARVLCLDGRASEAVERLQAVLPRWSDRPEVLAALGYSLREANRSVEALPVLRQALALSDSYPALHYNYGYCLVREGDREAGKASLRKAVALRPDYREPLVLLATLAIEEKSGSEAGKWAEALLEIDGEDEQSRLLWGIARLFLGLEAMEKGWEKAARDYFSAGLQVAPELPALWREAVKMEIALSHFEAAENLMQRWLTLAPQEPEIPFLRGEIAEKRGRMDDAISWWKKSEEAARAAKNSDLLARVRRKLER